ncbi:putative Ig domain-containing protein [Larkinella bovis]|uniref:Ig domain-containing protein n=1 Tax=Larkinella bovis TaxID=683041 RepID=A0ABW0I8M6_9BACT
MITSLRFYRPGAAVYGLFISLMLLTSFNAFSQKIFYVTPNGGDVTQDGSSWDKAYAGTQLQTAIEEASAYSQANGNQDVQVWVAAGTYKPSENGDQEASFSMRNHVAIYGGFVGMENTLGQRPSVLSMPSSTTLSGDIGEPGVSNDNTNRIIGNWTWLNLNTSAVLDGFVITGGDGGDGAGMYNEAINKGDRCTPTVRNCWFIDNVGAIFNWGGNGGYCNPILSNCTFIKNWDEWGGAIRSTGTDNGTSGSQLINCTFIENNSWFGGGGAVSNIEYDAIIDFVAINCRFIHNLADSRGGAINSFMHFGTVNTRIINCSFINNSAKSSGGAIGSEGSGKGIQNTQLINCIFWNNGGENTFVNLFNDKIPAHYCLFETSVTGYEGEGNQTTDRLPFVSETDLRLTACSPAIDAGDPASTPTTSGSTDLAGNPRFYNNGRIDIGAYEFQGSLLAAMSFPPSVTQPILQNTPFVALTVSGCEGGTLSWRSSTGITGTGTTIPVPTDAATTLIYSATCTIGECTSPPGTFTVTIIPPLVTGGFDGYIYGADCSSFRGWAWDRNKPNAAVSVEILDGPKVMATLRADVFRTDLQTAGKGNGKHAFLWSIPDSLKDGKPHYLTARVSGGSFILKDSPKALICQGSSSPGNKAPVPPSPTVLVAPLTAQVGVPFSGTLVAFTDPEGQPLTYQLSDLPAGLTLNETTRVISGTPSEAGTFVLAYSATEATGASPLTNSVSFPLTVTPALSTTVTGDFEGYLDKLDCGGIRGWVWDRKKPNTPLTVEFYLEGSRTVLGSTVANIYRPDLKDAGKGNGAHAYNFSPPGSVSSGTLVRARVLGSTYELKGGAKAYQCAPARLSAETGAELEVRVLGNPVWDQLEVEIRGAEGQSLRLQLTDASGRLLHQRQIEGASPVEQQTFTVREQPAGLMLLQVTSRLKSVMLKVLKQ